MCSKKIRGFIVQFSSVFFFISFAVLEIHVDPWRMLALNVLL